MKAIEDMTLSEIRELKKKYKDEFKKLVEKFFKEHSLIDYVWLYEKSHTGGFGG